MAIKLGMVISTIKSTFAMDPEIPRLLDRLAALDLLQKRAKMTPKKERAWIADVDAERKANSVPGSHWL